MMKNIFIILFLLFATIFALNQKTQSFSMADNIATSWQAITRLNGYCTSCRNGPENMYTAAFGDTLLVAYQTIHNTDVYRTEGNLATFRVDSKGSYSLVSNIKFPYCWKMGGVAANEDGSVIGLLCRGLVDTHNASAGDPPGTISFIDKYRNNNNCSTWEGQCYPMGWFSILDSPLYLLEFTGGKVTNNPNSIVLINHATGGANYGHLSIEIDSSSQVYFVDLKITLGPSATNRHQGNVHFGIFRSNWTRYSLTDGFACGPGHTISNRLAYNKALNSFSRYCMIDTFHEVRWGTTPTPPNSDALVLTPAFGSTFSFDGGAMNIVSLGSKGWMASAVGPDRLSFTSKEDTTIGVIKLPKTHQEYITDQSRKPTGGTHDPSKCLENGNFDADCCASNGAASCADGYYLYYTGQNCVSFYQIFQCWKPGTFTPIKYEYNWKWLKLPEKTSNFTKRAGMVNLANIGKGGEDSGRVLVGWSPAMATQGIADEYLVQELNTDGEPVGNYERLQNTGWGEDNEWVYIPKTGCVAFPFTWKEGAAGPGKDFPLYGAANTTKTMRITTICSTNSGGIFKVEILLLFLLAIFLF